MNSIGLLRGLGTVACLGSCLAWANGSEPAASPATPVVMPLPGAMPVPQAWPVPPMPVASFYPVFPGGMAWTPAPYYPPVSPMFMGVPPGWVPYVMVLVPVQAPVPVEGLPEQARAGGAAAPPATRLAAHEGPLPAPAPQVAPLPVDVDYGPIAATPVVGLASLETGHAIHEAQAQSVSAPSVVSYGPVAPTPVVDMADLEKAFDMPVAGKAVAVTAGNGLPVIDYGPIAPTPVVSLAGPKKPAVTTRANAKPAPPRAAVKPGRSAQPAKPRMCWHNGIVSPCK